MIESLEGGGGPGAVAGPSAEESGLGRSSAIRPVTGSRRDR
ncbi:hypothetical protein [Actinomadura sp. DC4]|nr:hypothetical protein [Actinomadura sp. DC4]MDN3356600.1 hypothetical protein [Actinomadura sp. DC4]